MYDRLHTAESSQTHTRGAMVSGMVAWQERCSCASATAAGGLQGLQALSPRRWPPLGAFIKLPALRVVHDWLRVFRSCNGLKWKWARTAINGNLGPDYLHLSIPSRRDSVQRRLQSVARDCNQGDQDHVTCNYPGSPSSTCLYAREGAGDSGERRGGAAVSCTFRPGSESVSPRVNSPC